MAYSSSNPEPPYATLGSTTKLNLFSAVNSALKTALETDPTAILFGEDIAFGGVFRCSQGLRDEFGEGRVFNTPLSENGIAVSSGVMLVLILHLVIQCNILISIAALHF